MVCFVFYLSIFVYQSLIFQLLNRRISLWSLEAIWSRQQFLIMIDFCRLGYFDQVFSLAQARGFATLARSFIRFIYINAIHLCTRERSIFSFPFHRQYLSNRQKRKLHQWAYHHLSLIFWTWIRIPNSHNLHISFKRQQMSDEASLPLCTYHLLVKRIWLAWDLCGNPELLWFKEKPSP